SSHRPVDDGRFAEVDGATHGPVLATAVGVAVISVFMVGEFGPWYTVAGSLPLVWLGLRRWVIDPRLGPEVGGASLVVVTAVACVWCTSISGGTESPGFYFSGLVAMLGMALFAEQRWIVGLGPLIAAAIVALDAVIGRPLDVFVVPSGLLLSVMIPAAARNLSELEYAQRRRAVIDPLTGCLNRRSLDMRADELGEQAARIPTSAAAIAFDVDHFKAINDEHGHAFGDRVLSHVAYVVRKQLRGSESVYRTGGEEFVVLLPSVTTGSAVDIAERLRAAIAGDPVEGVSVTASFGVAESGSPFDMAGLLHAADQQVYAAKEAGRNRVRAAEAATDSDAETAIDAA
ncbi:MAG: GGDEF domain-containing protein, partial [Actinomycetota bacterium]